MNLGTFCTLYDSMGDAVMLPPQDEARLKLAVRNYLRSGETQDELLELDALDGCTYYVRVSAVGDFYVSSPDSRRRRIELELAATEEDHELRVELGLMQPWDSPAEE